MSAPTQPEWGSDLVADALRATGVRQIALTPGSSFRGLHDSLVNRLGNTCPEMLVCLHEEHAVALAHGYAKVTGAPMAAALHANVGLMHATMALYNAWCDRVPMLVLGATGPVDSDRRRPWIDWIHTAQDQGALVRNYVKWDDQPSAPGAAATAVLRANQLTRSAPTAPAYVCLDAGLQETRLDGPVLVGDVARYEALPDPVPDPAAAAAAARVLAAASRPVILAGRTGRALGDWRRRVRLAEGLGAQVVTDLKTAAAFPTDHPLHPGWPATALDEGDQELVRRADAVLALDWVDLGGTLRRVFGDRPPPCQVIVASVDHQLHNGWSKDHFQPAPADVTLACPPGRAVTALLAALNLDAPEDGDGDGARPEAPAAVLEPPGAEVPEAAGAEGRIRVAHLAHQLRAGLSGRPVSLLQVPFAWQPVWWPHRHPLDYLGKDGGAGLGAGPGIAVGAALGLKGTGRLPVAVLGDGDYLMGLTALWTAARYQIPLLVVVANNGSYFNDEVHQDRVAQTRGRDRANRSVGQRIETPTPDLATLATGQGLAAFGPVTTPTDLPAALAKALTVVEAGRPAVVDVHVERGYPPDTAAAIAGTTSPTG